jgi:hypothetical protein
VSGVKTGPAARTYKKRDGSTAKPRTGESELRGYHRQEAILAEASVGAKSLNSGDVLFSGPRCERWQWAFMAMLPWAQRPGAGERRASWLGHWLGGRLDHEHERLTGMGPV